MASSTKLTIGIECESLEQDTWGIARMTRQALEEIARDPALHRNTTYVLYSKRPLPNDPLFDAPCFVRRPLAPAWLPSFSLYYYLLLPIRMLWDGLSSMYLPNYMLPWPSTVPTLVMLTDDIWYESRNPKLPLRYRLAYRFFAVTLASRFATRIMAISEASKRELIRLLSIPAERMETNHLGVHVPTDTPAVPATPTSRYILSVGQAFERRNTRETILAFAEVAMHDPSLSLVLIGPDRYHPLCVQSTIDQVEHRIGVGRISWNQQVDQASLSALMAHAQCIVYVSDREAFGLPPLEGLAHGTVPIVADAPVSHETLGDFAVMVRPTHDVDALAKAITRACSDTELRMHIAHNRTPFVAQFSWARHAKRLVHILHTISR